ncbi:MAG: DUF2384 domain-containing protein [Cyclobacteriaceae bacterium]|nr:DUF2384 domain-containing protein [Cyclobacteriaceae bacterium HetDA_MAG_MS6]
MEKNKEYKTLDKSTAAEEPFVPYSVPISMPLAALATMKPQEISKTHLEGEALQQIQKETSLSAQILSEVLGVGKSKYYDLLKAKDLDSKSVDALADLAALWQKGVEAFDEKPHLLQEWLNTRNKNLGGIYPLELFSTRIGRRELEKAFMRVEYSLYG